MRRAPSFLIRNAGGIWAGNSKLTDTATKHYTIRTIDLSRIPIPPAGQLYPYWFLLLELAECFHVVTDAKRALHFVATKIPSASARLLESTLTALRPAPLYEQHRHNRFHFTLKNSKLSSITVVPPCNGTVLVTKKYLGLTLMSPLGIRRQSDREWRGGEPPPRIVPPARARHSVLSPNESWPSPAKTSTSR